MSKKMTRRQKSGRSDTVANETRKDLRAFGKINASDLIVTRRITGASSNLSTNAGGLLIAATLSSSANASSAADFANLAGLFLSYRVRAIKTRVLPFAPVPYYNGVGVVLPPPLVAVGEWRGGLAGATFQSIADSSKSHIVSCFKEHTFTTHFDKDNDAQLWTPTTTAIPTSESYGLVVCGGPTASTVNLAVWAVVSEYLIQFRGTI